ncbi:MAG: serine protease [Verrucomicrobiia bacterium]
MKTHSFRELRIISAIILSAFIWGYVTYSQATPTNTSTAISAKITDASQIVSIAATNALSFATIRQIHFDQQMLFSTVRIQGSYTNSATTVSGTAFVYRYDLGTNQVAMFLVTNKHVVKGVDRAKLTFVKNTGGKPDFDTHESVSLRGLSGCFFGHPDQSVDIAIMPLWPLLTQIKQLTGFYVRPLGKEFEMTAAYAEHMRANEQVAFFGYPLGVFDTKHNLPLVRRGYTASPVGIDFEGQKVFLIDAAVFPGSSGSPVMIETHIDESGTTNPTEIRWRFVGVITAALEITDEGRVLSREVPTALEQYVTIKRPMNLGVVTKAERVTETIEAFLRKFGLKK